MTNNEFNWFDDEEKEQTVIEPEEVKDVTPPPFYTENVIKPKKEKKHQSSHYVTVAVISSLITCAILFSVFFASLPLLKGYLNSDNESSYFSETDRETSPAVDENISTDEAAPYSNREIATRVSPSVVGVSNLADAYGGILNIDVAQGAGSGIILNKEGYILTNNHVIKGATKLKITLASGETLDAELVGSDQQTDIAILKVNPKGVDLLPATLGMSDTLQVGDNVFAIGNPLGQQLAGSFTHGVVSALNRKISVDGTIYNLIQTDAAINSGNSGGALVNEYGEVVGINSVKIAGEGVEGLGFAIPIDDAKPIIEDLISVGYVRGRPMLGVEVVELNPQISYHYNLPVNYGLFINKVEQGSGADDAGLKVGDIIIYANGDKVSTHADLTKVRDEFKTGDTITLTVNRDGDQKDFSVKLKEYKPSGGQE